MTRRVEIGAGLEGALAEPAGTGKAGAIVLVQEWWGINAHMESMADRFASAGFLTVAPDLYHGKIAKDEAEANAMMNALDFGKAVSEIAATVRHLQSPETSPRTNGKVAVLGFCMGGALSFASACNVPGLSAVVAFYGVPDVEKLDVSRVTAPIQAHFAKRDDWAKPAKAEAVKAKLDALGKPMELFVYDAGHAFMRDSDPKAHDPAAAKVAWDRALAFLREKLA